MIFVSDMIYGNSDRGRNYVVHTYHSTSTRDVISRTTDMSKIEYADWYNEMMGIVGDTHEIVSETPSQVIFAPLEIEAD